MLIKKHIKSEIEPLISHLFNLMFIGIFLGVTQMAKVLPLYKKVMPMNVKIITNFFITALIENIGKIYYYHLLNII